MAYPAVSIVAVTVTPSPLALPTPADAEARGHVAVTARGPGAALGGVPDPLVADAELQLTRSHLTAHPLVLRGDGAFEVARLYRGIPFAWDDHVERLQRSCAALRLTLDIPPLLVAVTVGPPSASHPAWILA